MCTRALWDAQIESLRGLADIRVPDLSKDDSLSRMADRLLAEAPTRFAIAGLSMGGYLCFEVVRKASHRVSHLALLDTTFKADTTDASARRQRLIDHAESGRFSEVVLQLLPLLVHPDRKRDTDLVGDIKKMAEDIGPKAFVRQQMAIMARRDSEPLLAKIKQPTLVLCGADDILTDPETHRQMANQIPNATLEVIANCGHLSAMEQPDSVSQALAGWLQRE